MNFFARFKKIFLIISFLAVVCLLSYFIWRLFFKASPSVFIPNEETPVSTEGFPTIGSNTGPGVNFEGSTGLPINNEQAENIYDPISNNNLTGPSPIASGGMTETKIVNNDPSLNLKLTSNGQLQYYDRIEGKFYKLNSDGTKTTLNDKIFHSVKNVIWAPTSDKAVIEYPDGTKIVYNFTTNKQVTLPSNWENFSFSASGDQIVAKSIGLDESDSWLVLVNDDGSQATAIEKIGKQADNVHSSWSPNNQIVALYTEGVDFNRQEVYFVGLNGENFKSTVVEGRGLQSQWSTDGSQLLYSVYNSRDNYNPRLWIVDATSDTIGQNRTQLSLQTWANKCTFASPTDIYCAVPDELPKGSGLLPQTADQIQDSLYKIDLNTGSQKLIAIPDGYYNISQIAVPEEQDYLYFTDKYSGAIHQIKLR